MCLGTKHRNINSKGMTTRITYKYKKKKQKNTAKMG